MYRELILKAAQENESIKIQSPCPERKIEKAERAVGHPFPKELKDLLRETDGDKYLLLSADEIIEQTNLNREIQETYGGEEFSKELDKLIFFASNGCGDYYCYRADSDGASVYIWEHELFETRKVAENIADLITKYYNNEI